MRKLLLPLGLAAPCLSPLVARAQPAATPLFPVPRLTLEQAQDLAAARSFELNACVDDTRSATRTTTTSLAIPLERGRKRAARVNAAERLRDLARARLAEAKATVRAGVVASYFATVIAQERVRLAGESAALAAAQQAYDAATTGFEAGKFGFLDVIDAQRSLLQARARHLNTLSSAWQAAMAIDRLLGR